MIINTSNSRKYMIAQFAVIRPTPHHQHKVTVRVIDIVSVQLVDINIWLVAKPQAHLHTERIGEALMAQTPGSRQERDQGRR